MVTALIVGVLALVGAVAARLTWRRTADERHSVQVHQHTLETLRHMADRREPGAGPVPAPTPLAASERRRTPPTAAGARPERSPAARAGRTGPRQSPESGSARLRGPVPGAESRPAAAARQVRNPQHPPSPPSGGRAARGVSAKSGPAGSQALVFVDDAAAPRSGAAAAEPGTVRRPPGGTSERFRPRPRHRPGRLALAIAGAVAMVAVGVGLALALVPSHPHVATARHRRAVTASHPATSAPADTAVPPASVSASTATYPVPASAYTVVLDASGECWVLATDTATGHVLWTGTMTSGETRSLSATGDMALRLGAASDMSVSMDGRPVRLPSGFQSPFTMTFRAA